MRRLAGFLFAIAILCGSFHQPAQAQDKSLTVFAAASMKNALDEANAAYTAKSGVKISASYAASSALAKQIEQGAPADVFISADTAWMDYSIKNKSINEATRVDLLGNSIVLIAPKDSKIENVAIGPGFDLAKLAGDGRITTGDVKAVPVGKYAKAALEKLGSWQAAEPKFAMAENVRAARFTAIGAFERATLAYFDWATKAYVDIPVREQVEVLVLAGDIAWQGRDPVAHVHCVLGRRDGSTVGGHLRQAIVRPTLELMLTEAGALERRPDPASGLALIATDASGS